MKDVLITFNEVYLNDTSVVGGKDESNNYLEYFDYAYKDGLANEKTFEEGEEEYVKTSLAILFKKVGNYKPEIVFGGDLTNQISISNQVAMQLDSPFVGIYGACSTLILGIILSGVFISSRIVNNAVCFSSSNYGTSERQFRYPLNYGIQKKNTTTITTTGAVSLYLSNKKSNIKVTKATIGTVNDISWNNVSDMGSPMAYAAYTTIKSHFVNTNTLPSDYDLILTGDLSMLGSKILIDLFKMEGIELYNHMDCGKLIFEEDKKYFCGGSGCACIGLVGFSYIKKMMETMKYKRVLYVGTGALHSKTSVDQKKDIPCIAHLVEMEVVSDDLSL